MFKLVTKTRVAVCGGAALPLVSKCLGLLLKVSLSARHEEIDALESTIRPESFSIDQKKTAQCVLVIIALLEKST